MIYRQGWTRMFSENWMIARVTTGIGGVDVDGFDAGARFERVEDQ